MVKLHVGPKAHTLFLLLKRFYCGHLLELNRSKDIHPFEVLQFKSMKYEFVIGASFIGLT